MTIHDVNINISATPQRIMCVTNKIPRYVHKIAVLKYFARFEEKKFPRKDVQHFTALRKYVLVNSVIFFRKAVFQIYFKRLLLQMSPQ